MGAELFDEWRQRVRWDLLMLYIGLAGLSGITGALTIIVFNEHATAPAATELLSNLFAFMALLFATWPFLEPALVMATETVVGCSPDEEATE
jgi:hypothetical protein